MPQGFTDDFSALVRVTAQYRQAITCTKTDQGQNSSTTKPAHDLLHDIWHISF